MGSLHQLPTKRTRLYALHRGQLLACDLLSELLDDEIEHHRRTGPGLLLAILTLRIVRVWAASRL